MCSPQRLLLLLQDKDKELEELLQEIQCEKAQAKTASELSKSMESMRGHLQAQLRCKEAENSRLCMQIKVPAGSPGGEGGGRGLAGQG